MPDTTNGQVETNEESSPVETGAATALPELKPLPYSFYARVKYTGDGATREFIAPFPYLDKKHVHVLVNGIDTADIPPDYPQVFYEWNTDTTILFDTPPDKDVVIGIQRETPREYPMVDFRDGSILTEADLDLETLQLLYIAQEAYDAAMNAIQLDYKNRWDAQMRRIINIAPGEDEHDAVNMEQYKILEDLMRKALAEARNLFAKFQAMLTQIGQRLERFGVCVVKDISRIPRFSPALFVVNPHIEPQPTDHMGVYPIRQYADIKRDGVYYIFKEEEVTANG